MTIRYGYALVKLSDSTVAQAWNASPPADILVPEAQLAVHGVAVSDVGATFGDAYKLVERQLDDQGPPGWKQKYAPDTIAYDGTQVVVTRAAVSLSDIELAAALPRRKAALAAQVVVLRERKLAAGFSFDFKDARGIHHIGTTPDDEVNWDRLSKPAAAAMMLGAPTTAFSIVTDTGLATITAAEWQQILIAAGTFGQPLYAKSFTLEAQIMATQTAATLDAIDINSGWPS